jgi:hypothetical protein
MTLGALGTQGALHRALQLGAYTQAHRRPRQGRPTHTAHTLGLGHSTKAPTYTGNPGQGTQAHTAHRRPTVAPSDPATLGCVGTSITVAPSALGGALGQGAATEPWAQGMPAGAGP